ncbi:uncharacterized protein LOC125430576 [Sphaerodactylus townsendi]|uniref:uncharacterized protein LOC125430576 n=1 Tax=Sphaerodactylus townsendi TaxID=933632 RepID=UPI0020272DFC|nr:uncharacterized protein LOC125430576 [Sphaerodactylus townsendi]
MSTRRNTGESKSTKVTVNLAGATPEKPQESEAKMDKLEQMLCSVLQLQTETKEQLARFQKETKEQCVKIELEIMNITKEVKENSSHCKKIDETLSQIRSALNEHAEHIEEIEDKMDVYKEQQGKQAEYIAMLELKQKETYLRIRGLPEMNNENLLKRILPLLQEVWSLEEDDAVKEIDRLYRVNSKIAPDRKLPRDIIINCVRKSLRDEILRYHASSRIQLEGTNLIILKEIPTIIRKKRKDYKDLADTLRTNNIRFRWNTPEGLSFQMDSKYFNINSVAKAQDFLARNSKNLRPIDTQGFLITYQ